MPLFGKSKTVDLSEITVVYDIKVGRCSHLTQAYSVNIFKLGFLRNRLAEWSQISYGASIGWRNEIYSNCPGHMTNMAAMPIYGKNNNNNKKKKKKKNNQTLKIFFCGTKRSMTLKVGMQHLLFKCYQIVKLMAFVWPLPFSSQGQICFLMLLRRCKL